MDSLEASGLLSQLESIEFAPATTDELMLIHTRRYIERIDKSEDCQFDPETYAGRGTPAIARLAAGAVLHATRVVAAGRVRRSFCAVRPPGHHATADRAMGFCFYNNAAVAAADFIRENPDSRVLILDWDAHHGNGTQALFYETDRVLYASVHQYPFYPGTGAASETGRGVGRGFTINKPLTAGSGDSQFLDAIDAILDETNKLMRPDLIIVSAGFDAHSADPLANLEVTVDGFAEATRRVCEFAHAHCAGKIISALEGGYNTRALADSVTAHVQVLLDEDARDY